MEMSKEKEMVDYLIENSDKNLKNNNKKIISFINEMLSKKNYEGISFFMEQVISNFDLLHLSYAHSTSLWVKMNNPREIGVRKIVYLTRVLDGMVEGEVKKGNQEMTKEKEMVSHLIKENDINLIKNNEMVVMFIDNLFFQKLNENIHFFLKDVLANIKFLDLSYLYSIKLMTDFNENDEIYSLNMKLNKSIDILIKEDAKSSR